MNKENKKLAEVWRVFCYAGMNLKNKEDNL